MIFNGHAMEVNPNVCLQLLMRALEHIASNGLQLLCKLVALSPGIAAH